MWYLSKTGKQRPVKLNELADFSCLQHERWGTPLSNELGKWFTTKSFQKLRNVAFKCYACLLHSQVKNEVRNKLKDSRRMLQNIKKFTCHWSLSKQRGVRNVWGSFKVRKMKSSNSECQMCKWALDTRLRKTTLDQKKQRLKLGCTNKDWFILRSLLRV